MKIESLIDRLAVIDESIMNEVANQIKDLKNKNNDIEKRIEELQKEVNAQVDQRKIA